MHLCTILLIPIFLGFELLLGLDKLLLHEEPVLDALQLEQAQLAFGIGGDGGQLGTQGGSLVPSALLTAHPGRWGWWLPFLLLLLQESSWSDQAPHDALAMHS